MTDATGYLEDHEYIKLLKRQNAKLRAALQAARPYVEHCAERGGSHIAVELLREIDALS